MRHLEDCHQAMLFTWSKSIKLDPLNLPVLPNERLYQYLLAVPNGGRRDKKEAIRLKKQGVKAGVSDMFLALPAGRYSGLWIELKRPIIKGEPKPVVSKSQKEWLDRMNHAGYLGAVCFGFDEAIEVIESYLTHKL